MISNTKIVLKCWFQWTKRLNSYKKKKKKTLSCVLLSSSLSIECANIHSTIIIDWDVDERFMMVIQCRTVLAVINNKYIFPSPTVVQFDIGWMIFFVRYLLKTKKELEGHPKMLKMYGRSYWFHLIVHRGNILIYQMLYKKFYFFFVLKDKSNSVIKRIALFMAQKNTNKLDTKQYLRVSLYNITIHRIYIYIRVSYDIKEEFFLCETGKH